MQFDAFDDTIKNITDEDHTTMFSEENSWKKMAQLLDEHLPQSKKRRSILWLWLPLLVISTAGSFIVFMNNEPGSSRHIASKKVFNSVAEPVPDIQKNKRYPNNTAQNESTTTATAAVAQQQKKEVFTGNKSHTPANSSYMLKKNVVKIPIQHSRQTNPEPAFAGSESFVHQKDTVTTTVTATVTKNNTTPETDSTTILTGEPAKKDSLVLKAITDNKIPGDSSVITTEHYDVTKKWGATLLGGYGSGFTAAGKSVLKPAYGISFSYAVSPKWTITAGWLANRKVYSADSTSYKTQYPPGGYNYKLKNIDADCRVFEFPLNVQYNFGNHKKHHWFVSTGLSSILMKEEDYLFEYRNNNNQVRKYEYSYYNKNIHLFANLNFAAGYTYRFNNRLSLSLSPYAGVPVKGIGIGKIRLYNAAVLVGCNYLLF